MTPSTLTLRQYVATECLKALLGAGEYQYSHLYDAAADADRYALALLAVWAGKSEEEYMETQDEAPQL
jgi:hypothetical protein